jgi:hypothetical protein
MIDLPDHGYTNVNVSSTDPGGPLAGTLGGPSEYINRPGARFSVTYDIGALRSADEARKFQALLEQGSREDVSYPWPLDFAPPVAGAVGNFPHVNVVGSSPAGAVIPMAGLLPGYPFKLGQPVAVVLASGMGFVHRVSEPSVAAGDGTILLPVFPWTRTAFPDASVVEVEHPRIRGILSWSPPDQGAAAYRAFRFTITERL